MTTTNNKEDNKEEKQRRPDNIILRCPFKTQIDNMLMSIPRKFTMKEIEEYMLENGYPASRQTIRKYRKYYIDDKLQQAQEDYGELRDALADEKLNTAEKMKEKIEFMMLSIDETDFQQLGIKEKVSALKTLSSVLKDMESLSSNRRTESDKAAREFDNKRKIERLHEISRENEEADIKLKEQQMNTPATRHLKEETQ